MSYLVSEDAPDRTDCLSFSWAGLGFNFCEGALERFSSTLRCSISCLEVTEALLFSAFGMRYSFCCLFGSPQLPWRRVA